MLSALRLSLPVRHACRGFLPTGMRGMCDTANLEAEYSAEITDVMTTYEEHAKKKQFMIGRVISNKATKSITVAVQRRKFVSKYNSYQRWTKKVGLASQSVFVVMCEAGQVRPLHANFHGSV